MTSTHVTPKPNFSMTATHKLNSLKQVISDSNYSRKVSDLDLATNCFESLMGLNTIFNITDKNKSCHQ